MRDPNEFHLEETKIGPPVKVSSTFRLTLPMDADLQHEAWHHKCDKSTLIRHAVFEYFERRGIDAWLPT